MTPEEFADAVREDNRTALSRLGSSKSVYADTGGEMAADAVLAAAADAEHHAAETFAAWADDESDDRAAAVFQATAAEERDHHERVVAELDGDHDPSEEVPAIQAYLRDLDDPVGRLGGLVGRTLAAEGSKEQLTAFFMGDAKHGTAGTFREMGGELDDQLARAGDALGEVCGDDADWDRAREAAGVAIQAAYEEYTQRLESMGVNPKPVC